MLNERDNAMKYARGGMTSLDYLIEIQRLENELKKHEWISVNDRLPDKYVNVLVYTECKDIFTAAAVETGAESIKWEDDYGYLDDDVTHWMPLPEPPKRDDADA